MDSNMDFIQSKLEEAIALPKCKKCGCMKDALETLNNPGTVKDTLEIVEMAKKQMKPIEYTWLGCSYCYGAVITNAFNEMFPQLISQTPTIHFYEENDSQQAWPFVPGEYFVTCKSGNCPVAVSTLASVELAEHIANTNSEELCIVGKTETENIGIEKLIKNVISAPAIRYLVLAGQESEGHYSGQTIVSLWQNGVNEDMRVIGSLGKHPVLRNIVMEEVNAFRAQVKVIDMIGCEDTNAIINRITEVAKEIDLRRCSSCSTVKSSFFEVPVIKAKEPAKIELDKAGYFVILPQPEQGVITVEHYSYDNKFLRVIEGQNARNVYWTIIENGWVSQLSHAAYIGKELAKAELSMQYQFKYVEDGA